MIYRECCIVFDVDGTLCEKKLPEQSYEDVRPAARSGSKAPRVS